MNDRATIFIVDDDPSVRDSLTLLLEQEDFLVESFPSAEAFLAAYRPMPHSCAIIDLRMPGMDGMQLHAELNRLGILLPIIFLTGHGSIPTSVRAVKAGAIDFLTKPVRSAKLIESLQAALGESDRLYTEVESNRTAKARLESLTAREREVMALAVEGLANKKIARCLGISHRTVEIHKARIMFKTGAENLLDLARIADSLDSRS